MQWTGSEVNCRSAVLGRFMLARAQSMVGGVVALSNVNVEVDRQRRRKSALTLSTRRPSPGAGHRSRPSALDPDALTCPASGCWRGTNARLGRAADRAQRRFQRPQSRPAALRGQHQALDRAARTHRGRRQSAQRQARSHDRRGASLRRKHRQRRFGFFCRQQRHRRVLAHAIRRCRPQRLRLGQIFGVHKIEGPRQSGDEYRRQRRVRDGGDPRAQRHGEPQHAHAGALDGPASTSESNCCAGCSAGHCPAAATSRSGSTPFDELAINLKIDQGMVSVDDACAYRRTVGETCGRRPGLGADAGPRSQEGVATLISTANADEFDLPFVVQGPWRRSDHAAQDAQALIRRSGATPPRSSTPPRPIVRAMPCARSSTSCWRHRPARRRRSDVSAGRDHGAAETHPIIRQNAVFRRRCGHNGRGF